MQTKVYGGFQSSNLVNAPTSTLIHHKCQKNMTIALFAQSFCFKCLSELSGILMLKMKLIPGWWMSELGCDTSLVQHPQYSVSFPTDSDLLSACDYWCLTIFTAWFGVTVAVFRFSVSNGCRRKTACSFCAWTLTSPQGLGWCEPEMNTYCKSLCQSSQHLRQVLRRLPNDAVLGFFFFFLSFALNVSTRNSLAALSQIWQCLSWSGVQALLFNYN